MSPDDNPVAEPEPSGFEEELEPAATNGGRPAESLEEQQERIRAKYGEITTGIEERRRQLGQRDVDVEGVPGYDELEELEDALGELQEGVELIRQDYQEFMEGHVEGQRLYRDLIQSQMSDLEDLRQEHDEMETLLDEQFQMIDELLSDYRDLRQEHEQLKTTYLARLRDLKERQEYSWKTRALAGLFLLGQAPVWAELYSPDAGIADFYFNAPETYLNSPEFAVPTLLLPIAGLFLFKAAYDMRGEYLDTEQEINRRERGARRN